ncbi:hypothetical protein [Conexibacter woesei]|uniref:hypothetical protein n=1 Tax=Conexibacter woesei TaxID=191495 RepID=UPI00047C731E|nr:hypothetical protein [Conexibacter woesei]
MERLPNERYVVYWADAETHKVLFTFSDSWTVARDVLRHHTRDSVDEAHWMRISSLMGRVQESQNGFERTLTGSQQPGAFSATLLGDGEAPDVFVVLRRPGDPRALPLLGPAHLIDREVKAMCREIPGLRVDRATFTDDPFRVPSDIATGARRTTAAVFAFNALRDGASVHDVIKDLSVAELIWLGYEAGYAKLGSAFTIIAKAALARERSASTLNLCGSAHRREWHTEASEACYRDSIALVPSALQNPYGWIGLGATLRRRWEHDDAYDCVKRVLKYYPNNKYALKLKGALMREMGDVRIARANKPNDSGPSLIPDLPFIDSMPWDSEMTPSDDVFGDDLPN